MAEAIGVISGVLTVSCALGEAINQAKSLYRAQEEFNVLQVSLALYPLTMTKMSFAALVLLLDL